ncbi:cuticle collagen dpy-13-like isoform X2 [Mercenaria mercenaria]|uniref:cuticle collagen dpy-13-like isoform X2 n=1 Tax=Mercenaria mercenaria TaxID=6596 RepID=UPI00234F04FA|nr:cuticle collagen dpy-13-like isoform X2 [Mercenaria mercenaria]
MQDFARQLYECLKSELHYTDGARGGRSGGGYRSSSSRSRSRSRSSTSRSSSSKIRNYKGPSYTKGSWKTAAAVGVVFGLMSYKSRRMYMSYPNREPRICFNEKNLRNGTYGYFICPEEGQKDDMAYCCGSEGEQKCCTYTDKSAEGRIAGIVVGVVVGCVIIGVVVYCFCVRRRRQQQAKGGVILSDNTKSTDVGGTYIPEQQPLKYQDYSSGGGQQFPMQSYNTQPGFGSPQAYDPNAQGLPYSTNPGVPGTTSYPPPDGPGAYPQGPNPYPPPPEPRFEGQPPYQGAPAPIGFAGSESYPQPPPGTNPEGYPPPTGPESYPQPPPGSESYPQPPPGSYPGGFVPPTGTVPSAPPPSYDSTK